MLEHEPGDLTAIVEAGIRLSELQARLAEHGQMLALDPPGDPTIGACLAADLSGPRRHRYGAMRDLVIGVTVVLADGTVASSGGKVVKNVAGYDLGKLFSGSRGRLGLIARVALRLHPRPAAEATVVAEGDDRGALARAARVAARAERRRLPPAGPGSRCLFEGAARRSRRRSRAARALLGGEEAVRGRRCARSRPPRRPCRRSTGRTAPGAPPARRDIAYVAAAVDRSVVAARRARPRLLRPGRGARADGPS